MKQSTFWVWCRSDGYISATAYDPSKAPQGKDTFEILLKTQHWPTARKCIEDERAAADRPGDGWLRE